jgi:hypothetical protein
MGPWVWSPPAELAQGASAIVATSLFIAAFLMILTPAADARGGHGLSGHGAEFAGGHRHGNDSYVKTASDEREKLLDTKLKSICRRC